MDEHPIQGLMTTTMENLKEMIEVNTIIGDPVECPDGSVIIPVSKVGLGFAAGGSEFNANSSGEYSDQESSLPFGGGSGGGVSLTPVAFLIIHSSGIKMIHLDESTHIYEKIIESAPQAMEKIQEIVNQLGGQDKDRNDEKEDRQSNFQI